MPYVTDTHSIVWHIAGDPKLSKEARRVFQKTDIGLDYKVISTVQIKRGAFYHDYFACRRS